MEPLQELHRSGFNGRGRYAEIVGGLRHPRRPFLGPSSGYRCRHGVDGALVSTLGRCLDLHGAERREPGWFSP